MIEKLLISLIFLFCVALLVNMATQDQLGKWLIKFWQRLCAWPAARRRRIYQLNDYRATRERAKAKARSTSEH